MNNFRIRNFITLVIAFALTGCVSTSLEDAAPAEPTSLTVNQQIPAADNLSASASPQSVSNPAQLLLPNTQTNDIAETPASTPALTPAVTTAVDASAIPPKPENEEFPTLAQDRRGETNQMTPAQKAAIEAQMTELLIQRETDPRIKARYQARLKYLRRLAKTHASDTSAKIEQ